MSPANIQIRLRIRAVWSEFSVRTFCVAMDAISSSGQGRLWTDCREFAGWFESSLGAHVSRYVFSFWGPIVLTFSVHCSISFTGGALMLAFASVGKLQSCWIFGDWKTIPRIRPLLGGAKGGLNSRILLYFIHSDTDYCAFDILWWRRFYSTFYSKLKHWFVIENILSGTIYRASGPVLCFPVFTAKLILWPKH